MYKRDDLVRMAKRDNNKKRPYLLVNPLQGKHIPVNPSHVFQLFHSLAEKVYKAYGKEKFLIIGFAETATAIGAAIACYQTEETYYIQTTREIVENADYLFFTEDHSHAMEQRLVKNQLREWIKRTNCILFAEDEVTTGNTILNVIRVIKEEFSDIKLKFGVASILNGMNENTLRNFIQEGIPCTFLMHLEQQDFLEQLGGYSYDEDRKYKISEVSSKHLLRSILIPDYMDSRVGVESKIYQEKCELLAGRILANFSHEELENKKILVLGTEEFMYPALVVGKMIEESFHTNKVWFHATTRSPILPSSDKGYPISARFQLQSFYESERTTFIYNLEKYDTVIIIHDSKMNFLIGAESLGMALESVGNKNIAIFQWG